MSHVRITAHSKIGLANLTPPSSSHHRAVACTRPTRLSCPTLFQISYTPCTTIPSLEAFTRTTLIGIVQLTAFSSGFHRSCALAVQEMPCPMVVLVSHSIVPGDSDWCRRWKRWLDCSTEERDASCTRWGGWCKGVRLWRGRQKWE